jgi:hypothetical protein
MLWQLKKLSTNEALNEPQKLPENWGPIFGLSGVQDRLGDLSWLGENFADQGWFVVGDAPAEPSQSTEAELAWEKAKQLLRDSDWTMLSDIPMTSGNKALWIEYRRALRDIRLQAGFPTNIQWPAMPA